MVKIFIVDDDQSLQRLYALILTTAGFEIVATAINGEDAIEKYHQMKEKPNIILMDHRMPIKNGLDAMTEILQVNKNEKIIFASADISVQAKAKALGACAFLEKPFKMQELLNKIQSIVKELILKH
ncbi:MAG: response regulator [Promethearchaeota archaeon]|nr:MAG: response regulator [Candidatus Lokiarchaeota archaeon]